MFKVSFHTPRGKTSPIKKFLDSVSNSTRSKIIRQLKYVQEFGLNREIPNLKKIASTPLWELRILGKDNIRIICVAMTNKEVKVLHIFAKKTQKTPQKELNIALNRYKETTNT